MPTALTLTFDQTGLTPGVVDRARTDISSLASESGRAFPVTITIDGIPDAATADIELLDEPPSSNPLLTQVSATVWRLEFDAGVWGPFRVRCRAVNSGRVVASVTRRISIRSPNVGIAYPANAERIDPGASSVASAPSVALTEMNEGGTNRPIVDFHRELVEHVEALAVGSIDPTARSAATAAANTATAAGAAASAAQSTANAAVPKALYDANTVLAATTDDTPAPLTMAPSTGLFRLASGNIKAATTAEILALLGISAPWVGNAGSTPLFVPPASKGLTADSRDDELDSTTLDTAWQAWDSTNNINRTLTGNINLTSAFANNTTTPPRFALHTSGAHARASWLRLQVSDCSGTYYLTKPATLAVGEWLWARISPGRYPSESSNSDATSVSLVLIGTTTGLPSLTKRVSMNISRAAGVVTYSFTSVDTGGGGSQNGSIAGSGAAREELAEYIAIYRPSSTKYMGFVFNDGGQQLALLSLSGISGAATGLTNVATLDRIGISINTQTGNAPLTYVPHVGLDFVRFTSNCPF
jgi:hypothetical protein